MKRLASREDARVIKTQEKLRQAALQLAAKYPIQNISVAQLCREASIDRATFYRHANSPLEVLNDALVSNLDSLRDQFLISASTEQVNLRELWIAITRATVTHIRNFETVYSAGFASDSNGELENLFRRHVQKSMNMFLNQNPDLLTHQPDSDRRFMVESMAASLAASLTAILRTWINSSNQNENEYIDAVLHALPAWLQDAAGSDSLDRVKE